MGNDMDNGSLKQSLNSRATTSELRIANAIKNGAVSTCTKLLHTPKGHNVWIFRGTELAVAAVKGMVNCYVVTIVKSPGDNKFEGVELMMDGKLLYHLLLSIRPLR